MPASASTLPALRQLLSERFPQAARPRGEALTTGITALDETTGGLPRRALTELACTAPSCGGHLFLGRLLELTRTAARRAALADATDEFDPGSWPAEILEHLVWVRCRSVAEAVSAADLLARDANLDLLALDLRHAACTDLRRIPAPAWYRLQRAVEQTNLVFLVLTPAPLVPSAQLRLVLDHSHHLADQPVERLALTSFLPVAIQRQRLAAASA
jgi:hypothetical protein